MALVHSIQTFSAVDGPGLRCVVFLQGCPLRCLYCHNPDTHDVHQGEEKTVDEVMEEVLRCQPYYGRRGGLTLSGGEPLLQPGFAAGLFARCRRFAVATALDTSGCLSGPAVRRAVELADLVLLDVKYTDATRYRELVGGGRGLSITDCRLSIGPAVFELDRVKEFLGMLDELEKPFWVRQVIVPGWNDSEADADALADMLRPHKTLQRVELLPFRSLGRWKYERLGRTFELADTPEADPEQVARLEERVRLRLGS